MTALVHTLRQDGITDAFIPIGGDSESLISISTGVKPSDIEKVRSQYHAHELKLAKEKEEQQRAQDPGSDGGEPVVEVRYRGYVR